MCIRDRRYLAEEHFKAPVVVKNYPKDIKAFYMRLNEDGKTVAAKMCIRDSFTWMQRINGKYDCVGFGFTPLYRVFANQFVIKPNIRTTFFYSLLCRS